MYANPRRGKEEHRGIVQTVITHNVPMQLSRYFLPQVSIPDSSGKGRNEDPGLDSKGMRMDRGGDPGRECVIRPCPPAFVHPPEELDIDTSGKKSHDNCTGTLCVITVYTNPRCPSFPLVGLAYITPKGGTPFYFQSIAELYPRPSRGALNRLRNHP